MSLREIIEAKLLERIKGEDGVTLEQFNDLIELFIPILEEHEKNIKRAIDSYITTCTPEGKKRLLELIGEI